MNEILRAPRHVLEVPDALQQEFEKYRNRWSPYGPTIQVRQETVDGFTALTGDDNPIHTASAEVPYLPGFLTLSLMPKLLEQKLPMQVPGRRLWNVGVTCRFARPVPVGAGICMRYRGVTLLPDRMSLKPLFDFEIAFADTKKNVVEGQIHLRLV